jgi:ABC-type cobalamin/Fe3+-siderophores transport system ATPase subunit
MNETRRWQLQAVFTPDLYTLQLQIAPDDYRPLSKLSGGEQVSLLLSLFLESEDSRPLVIDQPEDELDKAYLFDVVLTQLRKLKGRRQLIFVTHDANIVVNGDADQVIYLKADADSGHIEAQGAIERPDVKAAILTVLDGGAAAFELRSLKYGF